jgi:hypothetical protein
MIVITRNTTLQQPYILFNPAIITPLNDVFDEMFLDATVDRASYSDTFNALIVYFIHMVLDYGNKKQIAGWVNIIGSGMSVMYPTLSDGSNNKKKLCKWLSAAVARSPYCYPSALEIICKLRLLGEKPLSMRHHLSLVNGETPLLIEVELPQTRASSNGETPPFFVCCDGCGKWRIWPYSHRFEINIDVPWYCSMNVHDMLQNSCDAPLEDGCTQEELPQRVTTPG